MGWSEFLRTFPIRSEQNNVFLNWSGLNFCDFSIDQISEINMKKFLRGGVKDFLVRWDLPHTPSATEGEGCDHLSLPESGPFKIKRI